MTTRGYLGIDCGTQGLSVIFTNEQLEVLGVGEGHYEMVPEVGDECYEQRPDDWISALKTAMTELRTKFCRRDGCRGDRYLGANARRGAGGRERPVDRTGTALVRQPQRSRGTRANEAFRGAKMPKRATATRWLWTLRNQPEKARNAQHMTTPAGWIARCLTGQWLLGIGDAAGMFPIDQSTLDYDKALLASFDQLVGDASATPLALLLPTVRKAGEDGGSLDANGAMLLGLPEGIPVAPAEGDQPAALAGSLIGNAGLVSCSFGTSVCANSVGDRQFKGVSEAVDHFCAPDGKPINMVCLRNGTTFMNTVVGMFGEVLGGTSAGFDKLMPLLLEAEADCGGLIALPFMDDEPGLGVSRGGTAMIVGFNAENAKPGNVVKSALLSTIFNLRLGSEDLDAQDYPRTQLVLTGGLTKTPELAQLLADVFNATVSLPESAEEGTAWGAALMAKYRDQTISGGAPTWEAFLGDLSAKAGGKKYEPIPDNVARYNSVFDRYKKLVSAHGQLDALFAGS